jgi:hypothetical protein
MNRVLCGNSAVGILRDLPMHPLVMIGAVLMVKKTFVLEKDFMLATTQENFVC